jgi:hypothetical protein
MVIELFKEAQYRFNEGPLTSGTCFENDSFYINCQLCAHIVLEELGFGLPKWLRSAEFYRRSAGGKVWVEKISFNEPVRKGDIFLLAPRRTESLNDNLIFRLHLAVCIEERKKTVMHISQFLTNGQKDKRGGKILEQPLDELLRSPRYNTLVGIRRPLQ